MITAESENSFLASRRSIAEEKIYFPSAPACQLSGRGLTTGRISPNLSSLNRSGFGQDYGGSRWGPSPSPPKKDWRAVASPSEPDPSLARILRDSRLKAGEILLARQNLSLERRKLISQSNHREALATGRIGFGFNRNLTSGRWKADGPLVFSNEGERRKASNDSSSRFLAQNPTEARAMGLSGVVRWDSVSTKLIEVSQ